MKDRAYESISNEEEVCCLIGQAVIELSDANQPVNKSTLSLKLLSMADQDTDDEKVMLYWLARRAITRQHYPLHSGVARRANSR